MPSLVFFNASVILAGLKSPTGASAKLLELARQDKIRAAISEVVLDEAGRNLEKIDASSVSLEKTIAFFRIEKPPAAERLKALERLVIDPGDAHLLASAKAIHADFLVTLDKKHLLVLAERIKWTKIVSPGGLLKALF